MRRGSAGVAERVGAIIRVAGLVGLALATGCADSPEVLVAGAGGTGVEATGKADGAADRNVTVLLTAPHCDVCTAQDKAWIVDHSAVVAEVVARIDGARSRVDVAQFTFSVKAIEEALLRASQRGVAVRVAMDAAQDQPGTVAKRLEAAGVAVRFVAGRAQGGGAGLQHAKFMRVDDTTLLTGSNNWSSTGTTINEENTLVVQTRPDDPLLAGFACHYEAIWAGDVDGAGQCSNAVVAFAPSSAPIGLIKDALRAAERSIDVLMHHLVFDDLVKELAKAAERGIRVRVVVNEADRAETAGSAWDRLRSAGGEVRFKRGNADLFQLMHHKLAIVDERVLINGSGNWSGSAFFNNFENYARYDDAAVVRPFVALYGRLWRWALSAESLDAGRDAARQHAAETLVAHGNLHAHFESHVGEHLLDDGNMLRLDATGTEVPAVAPHGDPLRYAWEYARDVGRMDFMAVSPHCTDERPDDPKDLPNMSADGYELLLLTAEAVTRESGGSFAALPALEWNTNSLGNHINVFGRPEIAKVLRGRFDLLYSDLLPRRTAAGDRVVVQLNHPRTFRHNEVLNGSWDQVFGVRLSEIAKGGERNVKFNDYGLDDFPPLSEVRDGWLAGDVAPDPAVVDATLATLEAAGAPWVRLMEVTVGRGKELRDEQHQNPSLTVLEDGTVERFTRVHSDWDYYLLHGFRLAPTAPHDNHYANWGTGHSSRTGVITAALSEDAILRALDDRATFASEDENFELRVYGAGRVPMGQTLRTLSPGVALQVWLADPDAPAGFEVTLVRGRIGGDAVESLPLPGPLAADTWHDVPVELPQAGPWFVYLEVYEPSQNRMAWSAPIWLERLD